ncbi:MAG: replicative DNA helicase [Bacteroidales bacterium]|nr:replicative DNA helicase [Bacteroidales bacterium]MCF8349603.1 replicative DNA helicase [Bacteroidales bacterium]MCF8376044.1 replicative DNA helicase [Bacteroidales bacterium]MCF8400423.1 replicative DNA helicase [Bacteroidales bacterium]
MDEVNRSESANSRRKRKSTINQVFSEHGKVPPQAVDLEEAVLGAIMLEKDALTTVIDILKPDVFYKDAHQIIFSAITRLFSKSEPVDILTVTDELKNTGELEIAGGPYYITQLTNRVASSANVEYHVRIISQKFIQRELIRISSDIIKDAYEETTDVFDLLDKAEQGLFSVSETNLRRNYDDMQSMVKEALREIEIARDSETHLRGVPSGFTELDRVTAGWQKSDLVIIASRPGMGKTAFTLSMARNIAVDFKRPVAIFSLEMSSIQLVTRLISSETQLSSDKLKKGSLENYEWEQLNAKINSLVDARIFIDDTPALTIFELRAKCRRLKAQHEVEIIFVDYLQLMSGTAETKGNREQEISSISRSLKSLAKELDVPIIALSQLSRAVETRGGSKKPILSDLRESGAIEQDADLVIFLYRPEYYKIEEDEEGNITKGTAEVLIAKHRNGPLKDIRLKFIDRFARFEDLEAGDNEFDGSVSDYDYPNGQNFKTIPSKMNDMDDDDQPPF